MKRILICGGREYANELKIVGIIDSLIEYFGKDKFCIVQGGQRTKKGDGFIGADYLARRVAIGKGVCVVTVEANWLMYNKGAGMIRNQWMLDFTRPDFVIAMQGGNGTADMVARARKANIEVHLIEG